jgi:hypothetical protein
MMVAARECRRWPGPLRLLAAWLHPQKSRLPSEAKLRISDKPDGSEPWLTAEEQANATAERERQALERERKLREQAEQRLLEVEQRTRNRGRE